MKKRRSSILAGALLLVALSSSHPGAMQLPKRPQLPGGLSVDDLKALRNLPSLKDLIGGAPLTTSLADAVTEVPFLDRFNPTDGSPMLELPFGLDNGVTLVPGLWQSALQGFCLQAGTRAPTRGDGYLFARLKGSKADVIAAILNGLPRLPDAKQEDAQVLLWAILARAKVSTIDAAPRRLAEQLLSKAQLASIDKTALDVLPGDLLDKILGPAADPVRIALDTENKMRGVLAEPGEASYERLESLAMAQGVDLPAPSGREVPEGRWSLMPNGAFIRYEPKDYTQLTLQVYVPEVFSIARDARGHLTEIAAASGSTLRVEYAGDAISRMTLSDGAGARAVPVSHATSRTAPSVTAAISSAARLVPPSRRQNERADDLGAMTQLALSTDDPDASSLLNRAWAATLGDWAGAPAPAKSLADISPLRGPRVVNAAFVRPVSRWAFGPTQVGGGGHGGVGGGSGAAAGGGGKQRGGNALGKPPKDDAASRARRITDRGLGRVGSHVPGGGWGFRIPREILKNMLDRIYDAYRQASDALEGDPPRQDYRQFTKPVMPEAPRIEPGADLSAAEAANYADLIRDAGEMNAYLSAGMIAMDRHGGAVNAGDRAWASRQAEALIYLKRGAGLAALKVAKDLEKFGADARVAIDEMRAFGEHFASLPNLPAPW